MSTYASQSSGFVPSHLHEGPGLERASDICAAINAFAMETMGLGKADPSKVRDLSLREMLDAVALVERWNDRPKIVGVAHSIHMVPAERLVAAVYTLVHFADPSPCGDADSDEIPVRFTQRRYGQDFAQVLVIANRETKSFSEGGDHDDER